MVSMPMMIWVALGGGGGLLCVVSVLCGAGGGLTVQAWASSSTCTVDNTAADFANRWAFSTPLSVSTAASSDALRPRAPHRSPW